jgi:hypothetical protein
VLSERKHPQLLRCVGNPLRRLVDLFRLVRPAYTDANAAVGPLPVMHGSNPMGGLHVR